MASITGWGRSPGGGHGNPVQYSCLENPMNRGAWWVTVHRVTKSWTWPKRLNTNTCLTCVCVCMCVKWPQTCLTATPSSQDLPHPEMEPVSDFSASAAMFFTSTATLYNFMCTTYWFETLLYCNMIAIAVIIRTSITSHNYNFFLVVGKTNSHLASLMIVIQYHLSLIYCA